MKPCLKILQTIHPSLLCDCLHLLNAVDANPTYGQLDQYLAVANLFIQVFNSDNVVEVASVELKEK